MTGTVAECKVRSPGPRLSQPLPVFASAHVASLPQKGLIICYCLIAALYPQPLTLSDKCRSLASNEIKTGQGASAGGCCLKATVAGKASSSTPSMCQWYRQLEPPFGVWHDCGLSNEACYCCPWRVLDLLRPLPSWPPPEHRPDPSSLA